MLDGSNEFAGLVDTVSNFKGEIPPKTILAGESACLSGAFRQRNCCYETAVSGSMWDTMSVPGECRRTVCPGLCPSSDIVQPIMPMAFLSHVTAGLSMPMTFCCALQAETFSKIECTLTANLAHLAKYCQLWRLKPSTSKTVTCVST